MIAVDKLDIITRPKSETVRAMEELRAEAKKMKHHAHTSLTELRLCVLDRVATGRSILSALHPS